MFALIGFVLVVALVRYLALLDTGWKDDPDQLSGWLLGALILLASQTAFAAGAGAYIGALMQRHGYLRSLSSQAVAAFIWMLAFLILVAVGAAGAEPETFLADPLEAILREMRLTPGELALQMLRGFLICLAVTLLCSAVTWFLLRRTRRT